MALDGVSASVRPEMAVDYRIYHAINQFVYHHAWLGRELSALEKWAVPVIAFATFALWLLARPGGTRKWKLACACALGSAALALLINQIIGKVWHRERPFAAHPSAHVWGSRSHDPSFPSDHASAAFAIAFAVLLFDRVVGTIFLLALIIAIPDMQKFVAGAGAVPATITSPADVLNAVLPGWMANIYLLVVLAAIYVCCLAIQTSTIRLAFGMARDGKLPLARYYNKVSPTLHTPVITCLVVGVLAALPFIYYAGAGLIAIVATGMIYLSYLLGNIAILLARLRGWPTKGAPFKLGGWGLVVNLLGLAWGGSMLVNFLWPRPASNPSFNTILNPTGAAGGASLGGFGDSVPIFELVVVVIVVVGAVYYYLAQRGKTDQVVRAA